MAKKQLTPETVLLFLIRVLAVLAVGFFGLAFWHPWRPTEAPDWRCIGMAVACVAVAAICTWGLHALKR